MMKLRVLLVFAGTAAALALLLPACQQPLDLYDQVQEAVAAAEPGESYSLTVGTGGGGTVSPTGVTDVEAGSPRAVRATPNVGCSFGEWIVVRGTAVIADPTAAETTITLNEADAEVRATFLSTLTVSSGTGGTVSPSGPVTDVVVGSPTAVTATANTGYAFLRWEDAGGSPNIANRNEAGTTVTLTSGPATIEATFSDTVHVLTIVDSSGGSTVPAAGTHDVAAGAPQSIEAIDGTGYEFEEWSVVSGSAIIDDPGSRSSSVTLSGDATIRADFSQLVYQLDITDNGTGGTTTPAGMVDATHGVARTIVATAATGYRPRTSGVWTVVSGSATIADANSATTTVTLTAGDATIRAHFERIPYQLTVTDDGTGSTTPAGSVTVLHGDAQTITATPETGYRPRTGGPVWTVENGSADIANNAAATTQVTLTSGDATVMANFERIPYTLTIRSSSLYDTNPPEGTHTVYYGVPFAISVTAAYGQNHFNDWDYDWADSGVVDFADEYATSTTVTISQGDAEIYPDIDAGYRLTVNAYPDENDFVQTVYPGNTSALETSENGLGLDTRFDEWVVQRGSATIADPNSTTTTATAFDGDSLGEVEIVATYRLIPLLP